jgi:hypothetical protein
MIRAKFKVTEINQKSYTTEVVLMPVYDTTIEEDRQFQKATPAGRFSMQVDNPKALEQLTMSKSFYIDLTPIDE